MARQPRLDYPGARHHVMNRSARRADLFIHPTVCQAFVARLAELPARFDVLVHGYALMPNHYHLLLATPRANLSQAMKHLAAGFTQDLNRMRSLDGPVFKGRYRNRVVEDDAYWMHALAYIHLNPVRGCVLRKVDDSLWSSHRAYAGLSPVPDWLTTGELLSMFGSAELYRRYLREVQRGREPGPDSFDENLLWGPAVATRRRRARRPPLPSMRPCLTVARALEQVLQVTGAQPADLHRSMRGRRGNPIRRLAAWWLCEATAASQVEIAHHLRTSIQAVCRARAEIAGGVEGDGPLARWTEFMKSNSSYLLSLNSQ